MNHRKVRIIELLLDSIMSAVNLYTLIKCYYRPLIKIIIWKAQGVPQ